MKQHEVDAKTGSRRQVWKNACKQVMIDFGCTFNWLRKWQPQHFSMSLAASNKSNVPLSQLLNGGMLIKSGRSGLSVRTSETVS